MWQDEGEDEATDYGTSYIVLDSHEAGWQLLNQNTNYSVLHMYSVVLLFFQPSFRLYDEARHHIESISNEPHPNVACL
jgi:hypothetical protein